ncbi:MAG: hypothetical protein B7Z55_05345 [Planctomycetales bacterium 12-60-4]|nr:MAG: hypothetical protein B7Z55_05345 [Planctomycetales bacterium 12-60-4]
MAKKQDFSRGSGATTTLHSPYILRGGGRRRSLNRLRVRFFSEFMATGIVKLSRDNWLTP